MGGGRNVWKLSWKQCLPAESGWGMGDGGWGGGAASGVEKEWGERQASKTREERGGGIAPMGMQTVCWATKLLGQLG